MKRLQKHLILITQHIEEGIEKMLNYYSLMKFNNFLLLLIKTIRIINLIFKISKQQILVIIVILFYDKMVNKYFI